jgi:hypothetical protein
MLGDARRGPAGRQEGRQAHLIAGPQVTTAAARTYSLAAVTKPTALINICLLLPARQTDRMDGTGSDGVRDVLVRVTTMIFFSSSILIPLCDWSGPRKFGFIHVRRFKAILQTCVSLDDLVHWPASVPGLSYPD